MVGCLIEKHGKPQSRQSVSQQDQFSHSGNDTHNPLKNGTSLRQSSDPEVLAYYGHFKQFRSIIKKQHASVKQLKIDSFILQLPSCVNVIDLGHNNW
jgi:hypothetical protein